LTIDVAAAPDLDGRLYVAAATSGVYASGVEKQFRPDGQARLSDCA